MLTSDATRVVLRGQPVPKEETHFLFGVLDSQEGRGADHRTVRHGRHQAHHPDVGRRTQRAGLRREPIEPDRQSVGGVALALCQQWEGNLIRQKSSDSRDAVVGRLKSDGVVAAREHDRAQPISVETSCT